MARGSGRLGHNRRSPHRYHRTVERLGITIDRLAVTLLGAGPLTAQEDPHMAKAMRVLSSTPLIDGHNDLPWAIRFAWTYQNAHGRRYYRKAKEKGLLVTSEGIGEKEGEAE